MSRTSHPARLGQGEYADTGGEEFWTEIWWRDVWTVEVDVLPAQWPSWGPDELVGGDGWAPADTADRVARAESEAAWRERWGDGRELPLPRAAPGDGAHHPSGRAGGAVNRWM